MVFSDCRSVGVFFYHAFSGLELFAIILKAAYFMHPAQAADVRRGHLFALQKAFAKPGGVMARKSASVCGCAHESCGISVCADL